MPTDRPNILLLMTDQQRGDCLGIDGHPVVQTPYIDNLAADGVRFSKGYTACPVCIPARRTLMTGQKPSSTGVMMNYATRLDGLTLPGELAKAGYQTHLVGKLHLYPNRKLYGFMSSDWADSPHEHFENDDDYMMYLREQGVMLRNPGMTHGANCNGWVSRPWPLEEHLHFTNWCADRAIRFLERRDPTMPFFLKVSFHQPHQPCTPPQVYWDRYMKMDLPQPHVGEWARVFEGPQRGLPVTSWRTALEPELIKQYQAGYYGCVNHIDDQIGRLLTAVPRNTIIIYTSDHGDMLGDHQWIRKRNAYEGSARVPYVMKFPDSMGLPQKQVIDKPVELMDIMPTLLDAAGVDIPDTVDGKSVLPLIRDNNSEWREYLHGECSDVPSMNSGMQYLTDGKKKYIWFPGPGKEQFFDLVNDPKEMIDLAEDSSNESEIAVWRKRLIQELDGRPEGFVKDGKLAVLNSNTSPCMPGYERE